MSEKDKPLKSAVFLHIQKTAGSSIVDLAREAYGSDQVSSHGDYSLPPKELDALVDAQGGGDPQLYKKEFISGHFGFDFAKNLIKQRYSFTFLRDPIERILSYYYFCRTRDPREYEIYALTQQLSLDEFLVLGFERQAVKACIWNNQAWQLANGYGYTNGRSLLSFQDQEILDLAILHLDDFCYVGFAESFEEDRDSILNDLNIPLPGRKVVSNANPGRPTLKNLPPKTRELLLELTHLDRRLYELAWCQRKTIYGRLRKKLSGFSSFNYFR